MKVLLWSRWAAVHGVPKSQTRLSNFTFTFHFHALEKEMATHSCVLAWRIPGTGEPGGLPSLGSHRVGHNWGDLAAAAADFSALAILTSLQHSAALSAFLNITHLNLEAAEFVALQCSSTRLLSRSLSLFFPKAEYLWAGCFFSVLGGWGASYSGYHGEQYLAAVQ